MEAIATHSKNLTEINDVCGIIKPYSNVPGLKIGRAMATIEQPTVPHYHKKMTEIYFVLKGYGLVIISSKETIQYTWVEPHSEIIIPPMHAHYTIPYEKMEVYVISKPEWTPNDLFELKKDCPEVGYKIEKEKEDLIISALNRESKKIDWKNETFSEKVLALEKKARPLTKLSTPKLRASLRIT